MVKKISAAQLIKKLVKKPRRKSRKPKLQSLQKKKAITKMRYVEYVTLDSSTSIVNAVYRANGAQDPRYAVGGHSPHTFDQWALRYKHYRVLSSKISVQHVPDSTANGNPGIWGVFEDTDIALDYTSGDQIIEDLGNKSGYRLQSGANPVTTGGGVRSRPLTASFNNRQLAPDGRNDTTPINVDPTAVETGRYYHLWCSNINGNDPIATTFMVIIDYIVEFSAIEHIGQS